MSTLEPRETGKFVSSIAKNVSICSEGIRRVSDEIIKFTSENKLRLNSSAGPDNLLPNPTDGEAVDFLFVSDVLNFSFWPDKGKPKWNVSWNGVSYTGYYALCAALRRAQEDEIPITDPQYYATISEDELRKIFRPEEGAGEIPLLAERISVLRQAGTVLIEKYEGTFKNCIKEATNSAKKLTSLITREFTSFKDEAEYEGKKVSFHKRAQILVGDIWMLFDGKGPGEFHDIDSLTVFADYRVPQVLVYFGALKYSDSLMKTLHKDDLLVNGSPEEVEIRACTIEAVERVTEEVKGMNQKLGVAEASNSIKNATQVDHFLWNYRRDHASELDHIPFHKARCIYY